MSNTVWDAVAHQPLNRWCITASQTVFNRHVLPQVTHQRFNSVFIQFPNLQNEPGTLKGLKTHEYSLTQT